jgi:hypothetical protein
MQDGLSRLGYVRLASVKYPKNLVGSEFIIRDKTHALGSVDISDFQSVILAQAEIQRDYLGYVHAGQQFSFGAKLPPKRCETQNISRL